MDNILKSKELNKVFKLERDLEGVIRLSDINKTKVTSHEILFILLNKSNALSDRVKKVLKLYDKYITFASQIVIIVQYYRQIIRTQQFINILIRDCKNLDKLKLKYSWFKEASLTVYDFIDNTITWIIEYMDADYQLVEQFEDSNMQKNRIAFYKYSRIYFTELKKRPVYNVYMEYINKIKGYYKDLNEALISRGQQEGQQEILQIEYDDLKKRITKIKPDIPDNLKEIKLYTYQIEGFYWIINTLQRHQGCILADEMGLGKTAQVITAILYYKNKREITPSTPALVIVPKSLIKNWLAELGRFAPTISVQVVNKDKALINSDIILTTYNIAVIHSHLFKDLKAFLLILDEAHFLKNDDTKRFGIIRTFHTSTKRILITGTPIENRIKEFFNLGVVIGNYIYNPEDNIGEGLTQSTKILLKEYAALCTLRRLYNDCTVSLPPKHVKDVTCKLTPMQQQKYNLYAPLNLSVKQILNLNLGWGNLAIICKLRLICNHPELLKKTTNNYDPKLSGKMMQLLEIITSLKEDDKLILFSQSVFTILFLQKMLRKHLQIEALTFSGKDSIQSRDAIVNEFQNSPRSKILLLSLKAGYVGINLTAANHVVHFDQWWNASVEDQASARAYRIGQKKEVTIYRFLTENTFEIKIDDVIKKKGYLCEQVLSTIPSEVNFYKTPKHNISKNLKIKDENATMQINNNPPEKKENNSLFKKQEKSSKEIVFLKKEKKELKRVLQDEKTKIAERQMLTKLALDKYTKDLQQLEESRNTLLYSLKHLSDQDRVREMEKMHNRIKNEQKEAPNMVFNRFKVYRTPSQRRALLRKKKNQKQQVNETFE